MLVTRYYERLLRQHGRTPQALAERADFAIHELQIYPDATDAFVPITID